MPDDEKAAVQYFLSGYAQRGWVICRKCGETGYWGGYGLAVRVALYRVVSFHLEPHSNRAAGANNRLSEIDPDFRAPVRNGRTDGARGLGRCTATPAPG